MFAVIITLRPECNSILFYSTSYVMRWLVLEFTTYRLIFSSNIDANVFFFVWYLYLYTTYAVYHFLVKYV